MKNYESLVASCKQLLKSGWTTSIVYEFMEKYSGWGPDSITYAIDEAEKWMNNKRAASKN